MKIYTKRGDRGETDLFGGSRVAKSDPRVCAYGEVDELNACLGAAIAQSPHDDVCELMRRVQSTLFDLGAFLATPDAARRMKGGITEIDDAEVARLESAIDLFERELEPLKNFILPGGCASAAVFHVARTVCRRAERAGVALDSESQLEGSALRFLNRLSDLLFVVARLENQRAGVPDVPWQK